MGNIIYLIIQYIFKCVSKLNLKRNEFSDMIITYPNIYSEESECRS